MSSTEMRGVPPRTRRRAAGGSLRPSGGGAPLGQTPGGTREGRPLPRVRPYPSTPASAASTPPPTVHSQRLVHQPEDQPSSGSVPAGALPPFAETADAPGTMGSARAPSTSAAPPWSAE